MRKERDRWERKGRNGKRETGKGREASTWDICLRAPEFPVTPLQIFEVWQGYLTDDFKSGTLDGVWGGYAGCGDIVLSRHTGPLKHLDRAPKCEAVLLF